jgi:hypothetical protein
MIFNIRTPVEYAPLSQVNSTGQAQITQIDGKEERYKASPSEIRSDNLNTRCCDFVNLTRQAVVNMPQINKKIKEGLTG